MTEQFSVRPLRREDMPACQAVYAACEAADGPQIFLSVEEMASKLEYPHFGRDSSWVAEMDGRLVGCAINFARRPDADEGLGRSVVRLNVHPEHRRRGIGTALWRNAVEFHRAANFRRLDTNVYSTSDAGQRFARRHGLQGVAKFWKMRLEPAAHRPGPREHPASLRTYRLEDADRALLAELFNESFAQHFGFTSASLESTRALERRPGFDVALIFLAEQGGRGVGFSRCELDALKEGWVEVLGVVPAARGTGLGRRLLDHSVEELVKRGAERVVLIVVGDNESALELYRSAGFTTELELHIFRLEL